MVTVLAISCGLGLIFLISLISGIAPRAQYGRKRFHARWPSIYHQKIYRGQGSFYRPHIKGYKEPAADYSVVMQKMWDLDQHGMTSVTFQLALQGITSSSSKEDEAPDRLFSFVNETVLMSHPTVTAFLALTDNYDDQSGNEETETEEETAEINAFLDLVCDTELMKEAHNFLEGELDSFPPMGEPFKNLLKDIWFSPYPRSKNFSQVNDSSAFEHVFIGDSKAKQRVVGGLHNWIQAYFLEKEDKFDYTGYIDRITELPPGRFIFGARYRGYHNYWKNPFSSFIFGSSPEFDLASFTLCFLLEPNKQCRFTVHEERLSIRTLRYGMGTNFIETAYPDVTYYDKKDRA